MILISAWKKYNISFFFLFKGSNHTIFKDLTIATTREESNQKTTS